MKKYFESGYSYITEIFSGFNMSSTGCPDEACGFTNSRFDPFTHLSVPIASGKPGQRLTIYDSC